MTNDCDDYDVFICDCENYYNSELPIWVMGGNGQCAMVMGVEGGDRDER